MFALQKAKQKKIQTNYQNLMHKSDGSNVMFFYCRGEDKDLNFIIFDQNLKSLSFTSSFVELHKAQFKEEFAKYKELKEQSFEAD